MECLKPFIESELFVNSTLEKFRAVLHSKKWNDMAFGSSLSHHSSKTYMNTHLNTYIHNTISNEDK